MPKKFLIVHLVSNGDCLMMTALAKQIKNDNPDCHLTWAISYKCKQVIENNPYIDDIWEVKYGNDESPYEEVWDRVKFQAEQKKSEGFFDEIIYSQISPDNALHFDGTTRSSTFRAYSNPITVSVTPTIRLYDTEIQRVSKFANKHNLNKFKHVVLCECAPNSGQSFLTPDLMFLVANKITQIRNDVIFIISTHLKLESNNSRIIDASELTFRENAELSKYCSLLVGCSSGITWLLTSDWAKKIPTVQFLNKTLIPFKFASVKYDFKYWNLPHSHILESSQNSENKVISIINECIDDFEKAKNIHHEEFKADIKMLKIHLNDRFRNTNVRRLILNIKYFSERNRISCFSKFSILLYLLKITLRKEISKLVGFVGAIRVALKTRMHALLGYRN